MEKLPIIETDRLILRQIEDIDAYDMFQYASIPYVGPNAGWQPHRNINETKAVIKIFNSKKNDQLGVFAVVLKESNKMIGTLELHSYVKDFKAELGYTINPDYWGKGYATEGSKAIIAWGFDELNLKRIECTCFTSNLQSQRVCEKLGLEFECVKKKGYKLYNGYIGDLSCYSIIDEDFYERIKEETWF